jgi:glutamate/tyrosine decarboxylase-like PLP-dependent enzyme
MVDAEKIRKALRKDTIAVIATCGVCPYGTIDPIEEIGRIADESEIYFHVDAAFGGLYCPWLSRLGYELPKFDFRIRGVCSIASDPHKNGYGIDPAGCIVYRTEEMKEAASFDYSGRHPLRLTGHTRTPTLLGTRPGIGIAVAWSLFNHLGVEGYMRITKASEELKRSFLRGLKKVPGLEPAAESKINLLAIVSRQYDLTPIGKELADRSWNFLRFVGEPYTIKNCLVVVFTPSNENEYSPFLRDLKMTVPEMRAERPGQKS